MHLLVGHVEELVGDGAIEPVHFFGVVLQCRHFNAQLLGNIKSIFNYKTYALSMFLYSAAGIYPFLASLSQLPAFLPRWLFPASVSNIYRVCLDVVICELSQ